MQGARALAKESAAVVTVGRSSVFPCIAAFALVLGSIAAASCGSPPRSGVSASTAGGQTPSEPPCLQASSLPAGFALPRPSDCVTSAAHLSDGRLAIGTQQGFVGVVAGTSVTDVRAASATGAVSDLSVLPSGRIAMFVVDQGVGLLDLATAEQIKLAGRRLTPDRPNVANAIGESYYFQLPQPTRPHDNSLGQLAATRSDGTQEAMALVEHVEPGTSVVCVIYPPEPHEAGCVDVSDIVTPLPTVPPATPLTGSDPCLSANASPADQAHQLTLTARLPWNAGTSEAVPSFTVTANERYTLTLTPADGVIHTFGVYDEQGNLVRDAHGTRMCLPPVVGSAVTVALTLDGPPRTLTLRDTAHPQLLKMDLIVAGPSPLGVATLTPSPHSSPMPPASGEPGGTPIPGRAATPAP